MSNYTNSKIILLQETSNWTFTVLCGKSPLFFCKTSPCRKLHFPKFRRVFAKIRIKNSNLQKYVCHKMPNRDGLDKIHNFCAVCPLYSILTSSGSSCIRSHFASAYAAKLYPFRKNPL